MLINFYRFLGRCLPHSFLRTLFWHRARKGKELPERQCERFGVPTQARPRGYLVWVHGASVGELASVRALVNALLKQEPAVSVLVTSGTVASARFIEPWLQARCLHQFIPYDLKEPVQEFLNHWQPDLALWVESEFWPALLHGVKNHRIPAYLLNGRMSYKSFRSWKKTPSGIKEILQSFQSIFAQSEAHEARFKALGAESVKVLGNIKLVGTPLDVDVFLQTAFKNALGGRPWFMAASTHAHEEESVLESFKILRRDHPDLLLVLAPRHPDRCQTLCEMIKKQELTCHLHSQKPQDLGQTDVYLIDQIGLLGTFFDLKPIVFLGGSLVPVGGHNFIEAFQLGCMVIVGPHMHKQPELMEPFKSKNLPIMVQDSLELAHQIDYYLIHSDKRQQKILEAQDILHAQTHLMDAILNVILTHIPHVSQSA